MKMLCLNPPFKTEHGRFSRTSRSPGISRSGTLYYPIWLCYVAGSLENAGHAIRIIDSCAYAYDVQKTLQYIAEFNPQMVVIDTSTPSIYNDVKIAGEIKQILPDCFTVLMGTHPTALTEETMRLNNSIDAIAVGEADYTIKELAQKLSRANLHKVFVDMDYRESILATVDGLAYRANNYVQINKTRDLIDNLDELPFVSEVFKKHLDIKKYFFAASDYPEVQIMTSRGCVGKCSFCVYPQTIHRNRYRMRTVINVVDEFEWIIKNIPDIRQIGIEDDTFTGNQSRVIEFCKEKIKRNITIKWYCNVRVDLKMETMLWMKKAGCVLVTVGYECADNDILNTINKKTDISMILEFSKHLRRAGILAHGCFMAGNRGETKSTLQKSLDLALKLMDDTMQFYPLRPYPGTKDYEWFKKHGLLTAQTYSDFVKEDGELSSVVGMPDMSAEEIEAWCDYARRKYYLRPRYIVYKLFQQIQNPSEVRRTFKSTKRFLRFLIPQQNREG